MHHLQSIERACQKAIPSILTHEIEHYQGPECAPEIEPVYRPITLQDILLVLEKNDVSQWAINSSGEIFNTDMDITLGVSCKYDLTKSPYDQSDEVLEFISKNI